MPCLRVFFNEKGNREQAGGSGKRSKVYIIYIMGQFFQRVFRKKAGQIRFLFACKPSKWFQRNRQDEAFMLNIG
jgi:hypothetical protein